MTSYGLLTSENFVINCVCAVIKFDNMVVKSRHGFPTEYARDVVYVINGECAVIKRYHICINITICTLRTPLFPARYYITIRTNGKQRFCAKFCMGSEVDFLLFLIFSKRKF